MSVYYARHNVSIPLGNKAYFTCSSISLFVWYRPLMCCGLKLKFRINPRKETYQTSYRPTRLPALNDALGSLFGIDPNNAFGLAIHTEMEKTTALNFGIHSDNDHHEFVTLEILRSQRFGDNN